MCHLKKEYTVEIYFIKKLKWNGQNSEIFGIFKSEPNPIEITKNSDVGHSNQNTTILWCKMVYKLI
jgi:hypothetical protein